jgi:hypothetical protein
MLVMMQQKLRAFDLNYFCNQSGPSKGLLASVPKLSVIIYRLPFYYRDGKKMSNPSHNLSVVLFMSLMISFSMAPTTESWGKEGHYVICKIA